MSHYTQADSANRPLLQRCISSNYPLYLPQNEIASQINFNLRNLPSVAVAYIFLWCSAVYIYPSSIMTVTALCSGNMLPTVLVTQAHYVGLSVCLSICLQNNSKTNDPKVFKLGTRNDLGISYKWYGFGVERSKVKVTSISSFFTLLSRA